MDEKDFLMLAIKQAKKSADKGGFPAGAIIVKDEKVLSKGISIGSKINDPTSHAEIVAIRKACQKLKTSNLDGAVMYESLECCNMCFSAAVWAGIQKIVYACKKTDKMVKDFYYEGDVSNALLNKNNNRKIELICSPEKASLSIIKNWGKQLK